MKRTWKRATLLLLLLGTLAMAQTPSVDFETERYRAEYVVNADGTYTAIIEEESRPLTQAGIDAVGQASMSYSESLQSLEVLEAYTLKKDGTKVPVPKDKIFVQAPPETQDAPTFSDDKVVKVVFPQLGIGDLVHVKWKLVQKKPYFPGEFYTTDIEPVDAVVKHAEIVVDYPSSMRLFWKARGDYRVRESTQGDRKRIVATFSREAPVPLEPGMVDPAQVSPAFTVTSFERWEAIGAAYWARAKDKAQVTDEIKKLADEIAGQSQGLEAAKKLYDWEVKNIRYVALELGIGGYVPQPSSQVLSQRYADCKGYVTLLQALLKAKGIRSEPVLINLGENFGRLPAPTPEQFNHLILYLPDYGVYLDPTTQYAPFGVLPLGDLSKPVVIASESPRFTQTPSGDPKRDRYSEIQTLTLTPGGTLKGSVDIETHGYADAQWRIIFSGVPKVAYPQVVQSLLSRFGEGGSGDLTTTPLHDLDTPFKVHAEWQSPGAVSPGDTLTLSRFPVGLSLLPLDQLRTYAAPESRRFPVSVGAFSAEYQKRLVYPDGYRPTLLPKDLTFKNQAGSFSARYRDEGNALVATIRIVFNRDVYAPEDYPALKKLIQTAVGNVSQPIIFEKTR